MPLARSFIGSSGHAVRGRVKQGEGQRERTQGSEVRVPPGIRGSQAGSGACSERQTPQGRFRTPNSVCVVGTCVFRRGFRQTPPLPESSRRRTAVQWCPCQRPSSRVSWDGLGSGGLPTVLSSLSQWAGVGPVLRVPCSGGQLSCARRDSERSPLSSASRVWNSSRERSKVKITLKPQHAAQFPRNLGHDTLASGLAFRNQGNRGPRDSRRGLALLRAARWTLPLRPLRPTLTCRRTSPQPGLPELRGVRGHRNPQTHLRPTELPRLRVPTWRPW